ncbi:hypothetical protein PAXINDRAFT_94675, partial [Paxillus involutus ATCC 200175]
FYKEELDGETTTHVAMMATRKGISRFEVFKELADTSAELYERILRILEDSPRPGSGSMAGMACRDDVGTLGFSRAREAFKQFAAGYILFHLLSERYWLMEVGL